MFRLFSKYKLLSEKAQISIFFLAIMTIMIVITFVTINIGKIAKDKTYSGNAADAGALAAASVSAYAFNYVANANESESGRYLENNWNDFKIAYTNYFSNADKIKAKFMEYYAKALAKTCCVSNQICSGAKMQAGMAANQAYKYQRQMNNLIKSPNTGQAWPEDDQQGSNIGTVPNYWKLQEDFYVAIRERVHDDQDGQNDLYQNALYAGYIYNLQNNGTSHRLGKINGKAWGQFLQGITPDKVRNGKPETFTYVDGAGRFHIITAIINIRAMRTFDLKTTQDDRQTVKRYIKEARRLAKEARQKAIDASMKYGNACPCPDSPSLKCTTCCPPIETAGDAYIQQAKILMDQAKVQADLAKAGLDGDGSHTGRNKQDSNEKIIKYIIEIQHDRMTSSSDFQFHMGGPIKGMRGDIDVPNFYPPIQSNARASFRGQGSIHPQKAKHDAQIISAN